MSMPRIVATIPTFMARVGIYIRWNGRGPYRCNLLGVCSGTPGPNHLGFPTTWLGCLSGAFHSVSFRLVPSARVSFRFVSFRFVSLRFVFRPPLNPPRARCNLDGRSIARVPPSRLTDRRARALFAPRNRIESNRVPADVSVTAFVMTLAEAKLALSWRLWRRQVRRQEDAASASASECHRGGGGGARGAN